MSKRCELLYSDWEYFEKPMKEFDHTDWDVLNSQRVQYYEEQQAEHALRLLRAMENDTVFGYPINPYRHCLQSATKVYQDGYDAQTVVTALFHDVGFTIAPMTHGEFAAALLKSHISEQNFWMLTHHGEFQKYYCHDHPKIHDRLAREKWKNHPYYEWTKEFVDKYDQNAMDPNFESMSLEAFEPMVKEVFSQVWVNDRNTTSSIG